MRRTFALTCLIFVCAVALAGQAERTPTTLVMARNVKRSEPGWRYVGGWCTCPPTVPQQVWRDNGTWERTDKAGHHESVDVQIVKGSSSEDIADWMRRFGGKKTSPCQVERYSLGDEGFLSTCPRSYRHELNYRKGPFLVRVRSDSIKLVERFAKYTLSVLPAT